MSVPPSQATLEREARVLDLRRDGKSFRAIAAELGIANPGTVYSLYANAQRRWLPASKVAEERKRQLDELDRMVVETWAIFARQHFVVNGGVIVNGPDGEPLDDDGPKLAALATMTRLLERRARLLGLDAPAKRVVNVVTHDALASAMAEMEAEMAELDKLAALEAADV